MMHIKKYILCCRLLLVCPMLLPFMVDSGCDHLQQGGKVGMMIGKVWHW